MLKCKERVAVEATIVELFNRALNLNALACDACSKAGTCINLVDTHQHGRLYCEHIVKATLNGKRWSYTDVPHYDPALVDLSNPNF